MKSVSVKQLWFYPLVFGVLGALIGLILRYAFTGAISGFPFKNVLHSHSHIMLLGFLFNALVLLLWSKFTQHIDRRSYQYYIAMQICIAVMMVAFIIQGYALISILFSTLHLWISYIFLIRLWKRIEGDKSLMNLIKIGIVFDFISSLGPYALGPLMVLDLSTSLWYQQAIFFYLHFQYLGSFFVWLLALLFQKISIPLKQRHGLGITIGTVLLYTHSLDYNFEHWLINGLGGIGAVLLFMILFNYKKYFKNQDSTVRTMYYMVLLMVGVNVLGSIPFLANLVETNRFILIAYLHFLFLGLYIPFIWAFLLKRVTIKIWIFYAIAVLFSEAILIFPSFLSHLFSISVMWLLFIAYLGVFLVICIVHLKPLFNTNT